MTNTNDIQLNYFDDKFVYVIVSGLAAVYHCSSSGDAIVAGIYGKGNSIGEINAFFNYKVPYLVKAITPMVLCQIPKDNLLRYERNHPDFMKNILSDMGNTNLMLMRYGWVMNAQRVVDRVRRLLIVLANSGIENTNGYVSIELTHSDLAFLINTDRVSISRALEKLSQSGLIKPGYKTIQIHDSEIIHPDEPFLFIDPKFND